MSPLVVMSVPFRQFPAAERNVERIIGSATIFEEKKSGTRRDGRTEL